VTCPLDTLPLFASDRDIGRALLGERAKEWPHIALLYERKGFPRIDPVMGGRYTPAVKAFFDAQYKVGGATIPAAPDGAENPAVFTNPTAFANDPRELLRRIREPEAT
jgi:hypothetical protein